MNNVSNKSRSDFNGWVLVTLLAILTVCLATILKTILHSERAKLRISFYSEVFEDEFETFENAKTGIARTVILDMLIGLGTNYAAGS